MEKPVILLDQAARSVIKSRDFDVYSMSEQYREIAKRTGINFDAAIFLLDRLPIFLNGAKHKRYRKSMAQVYAETRPDQERSVDETLGKISQQLQLYNGEIDVITNIANPIWLAVQKTILPLDGFDHELISFIPELFSPQASIRRRKYLNDRISNMISDCDLSSRDELIDKISLLTLGVRPLIHSIALSIYRLAEHNHGLSLREITYPLSFYDTGLRFVDRIAKNNFELSGCPHHSGTRFRCVSFDETYSDAENSDFLFGAGSHVCLGRPISLYIWRRLTCMLSATGKNIAARELKIATHEPFIMAEICTIELYDS